MHQKQYSGEFKSYSLPNLYGVAEKLDSPIQISG